MSTALPKLWCARPSPATKSLDASHVGAYARCCVGMASRRMRGVVPFASVPGPVIRWSVRMELIVDLRRSAASNVPASNQLSVCLARIIASYGVEVVSGRISTVVMCVNV